MLAINHRDAWTCERRHAILLQCLGMETKDIFYTLPNTGTTFNDAVSALLVHFILKMYVVVASSDKELFARMKRLNIMLQCFVGWL